MREGQRRRQGVEGAGMGQSTVEVVVLHHHGRGLVQSTPFLLFFPITRILSLVLLSLSHPRLFFILLLLTPHVPLIVVFSLPSPLLTLPLGLIQSHH